MECYMYKKLMDINSGVVNKWSYDENELVHKQYKSHCNATVTDGAFIEEVMQECIEVKSEKNL